MLRLTFDLLKHLSVLLSLKQTLQLERKSTSELEKVILSFSLWNKIALLSYSRLMLLDEKQASNQNRSRYSPLYNQLG